MSCRSPRISHLNADIKPIVIATEKLIYDAINKNEKTFDFKWKLNDMNIARRMSIDLHMVVSKIYPEIFFTIFSIHHEKVILVKGRLNFVNYIS